MASSRRKPAVIRLSMPDEEAKQAALKLLIEGASGSRTKPGERHRTAKR